MSKKIKVITAAIVACAYMYWGVAVAMDAGKSARYIGFVTIPLLAVSICLVAGLSFVLYAFVHNDNKSRVY